MILCRFFPNHLGPPVSVLANATFNLLVRIKLCKKQGTRYENPPASVLSFTVDVNNLSEVSSKRYFNFHFYFYCIINQLFHYTRVVYSCYQYLINLHLRNFKKFEIPLGESLLSLAFIINRGSHIELPTYTTTTQMFWFHFWFR